MSDAEVQIAKLFGADVEVNACTCQQNASEKRYSGVQGRADLSLFCVTLDCPYCGSTVDLSFVLVTMQCSFLFCLHKSSAPTHLDTQLHKLLNLDFLTDF